MAYIAIMDIAGDTYEGHTCGYFGSDNGVYRVVLANGQFTYEKLWTA